MCMKSLNTLSKVHSEAIGAFTRAWERDYATFESLERLAMPDDDSSEAHFDPEREPRNQRDGETPSDPDIFRQLPQID
jgi:hypothetical protein